MMDWNRALISAVKIFVIAGISALIASAQELVGSGVAFLALTTILKFLVKLIETKFATK